MSYLNFNEQPVSEQRMRWDELQAKEFCREIERYGFVNKVDDTVPLKVDKTKMFGRFKVNMDTKYKVYEVFVWQD